MARFMLTNPEVQARSIATRRRLAAERFWSKTDRTGECWVWTGARRSADQYGGGTYGVLSQQTDGRRVHSYAHRRAYELTYGPIPPGLFVLHSCDNPPCINPAHLSLGTSAENMAEAGKRHRVPEGKRHHWFKDGRSIERGRRDRATRLARRGVA